MTDEQSYWTAVREDADSLHNRNIGMDEDEDIEEQAYRRADSEVDYYWKQRRCIRWTDNLEAVEDVGIPDSDDANEVIRAIAFYAYLADVMEVYEREHT